MLQQRHQYNITIVHYVVSKTAHLPLNSRVQNDPFLCCNCNWGSCIAPPTRRPRAHHRVKPYPGARRQNKTEMFSDHEETSPSIAAALALSAIRQRVRDTTRDYFRW